jgi:hypothetical protein
MRDQPAQESVTWVNITAGLRFTGPPRMPTGSEQIQRGSAFKAPGKPRSLLACRSQSRAGRRSVFT